MARRPYSIPLFATDAAAGQIVEPSSAYQENGFSAGERPPAEWLNWLFNQIGEALDYLRGPSLANWDRITTSVAIVRLDADDVTEETDTPLHRVVGVDDAGAERVWATVRGDSWLERNVVAASTVGIPQVVTFTGERWVIGAADGVNGKVWWTWPEGSTGGVSAIEDDTQNWNASTVPGGTTNIGGMAADRDTGAVVAVTTVKILYSTDGTTFLEATLSAGPFTGSGVDVCWTGVAWLVATSTGEVWRATDPAGTWTKVLDTTSATWRLGADGDGNVVMYKYDVAGAPPDWHVSANDGASWTTQAAPSLATKIQRLRYLNGVWLLTSTDAPFLAQANALDADEWVRLPVPYVEGDDHRQYDVVYVDGAYLGSGYEHTLRSHRAEDTSPAPWVPSEAAAPLHDAAYLRGRIVAATAPAQGDAQLWDNAASQFAPASSITSTGLQMPVLTTAQRDAIAGPPDGLVLYNSTIKKLQVRANGAWETITSV